VTSTWQLGAGKVDEAEKLSETMMGQPNLLMPYQPFCDLRLHFPGHGQATDYRRLLEHCMLQLSGQIQPRQNPARSWTGSWTQPGMRFAAVLRVQNEGGSVRSEGGRLEVSGADSVTVLFSNATSFRNYRDIGGDALGSAQDYLRRAEQRSYRPATAETYGRFSPVVFSRCVTSWRGSRQ
jgi:hypothetical protein